MEAFASSTRSGTLHMANALIPQPELAPLVPQGLPASQRVELWGRAVWLTAINIYLVGGSSAECKARRFMTLLACHDRGELD
jgi:hypothetical protein